MPCLIAEPREIDNMHACVAGVYAQVGVVHPISHPVGRIMLPAVSRALIGVTLFLFRDTNTDSILPNTQYRTGYEYVRN